MYALHVLTVLTALAGRVVAQDDDDSGPAATRTSGDAVQVSASTTESASLTATATSTSGPATVTIAVGAKMHQFTPTEVTAKVGDTIKFNFYPGGHRVIRAEFGWACVPYEYAVINGVGFDSGFYSPQVVTDLPSYEIKVNDTEPIFFYCGAPGSCIDYKMIGVINPNATQTFDDQLKAAENAGYQLVPGDPWPSETASSNSSDSDSGGGGLSKGAIAGIAIGGAAVVILGAALLYLCGRRGGFDKAYRKSVVPPGAVTSPDMVEANYANAGAAGAAAGAATSPNPKSPAHTSLGAYGGHDNRNSTHGQPYYGVAPSPHPSPSPQYGLAAGQGFYDPHYPSPHASPQPGYPAQFSQAPVELPSQDVPVPARSPPPGYTQPHAS